jgi:3-oxoacyl-[acyl-carrier protein] reductase
MEEWHEIIHGNLSSVFYLCKLVIPGMRQKSWGRIINFGFNQAEAAPAWETRSVYAAAKAGLVSLTRTLALEEAEYGITVNMVTLGDIVHPWKELKIDDVKKVQNDGTPVGRMGSGEDVTRVISFLCDENSDFLTGGIIPITGGKTSFV